MTTRSKRRARAAKVQQVPMGEYIAVPLNQLVLSEANVRTIHDPEGIAALADSIGRRGLLQSLAVRLALREDLPAGTYEVIAGGRRFRALEALLAQGRMAEDAPIPCLLKTNGDAVDDSLAENNDREALHPLDEFRAFKAMRDNGRADEDIAAAYRVTPAVVRQRMRLANAGPVLLQAYANDAIELETLMAYCVVDDHARQERVFESVTDTGNDYPHQIKRLLTESTVSAHDKRVKFVGLAAYEAAGGSVLRDLFDEHHEGYLQDADLLNSLVDEKLSSLRAAELADGWAWAEVAVEQDYEARRGLDRLCPLAIARTDDQEQRLLAVDARLSELRDLDETTAEQDDEMARLEDEEQALLDPEETFATNDKARAGVFISLDWNGEPQVTRGYLRAGDRLSVETSDRDGAESQAVVTAKVEKLPDKVVQDLTAFRTAALRDAMAHDYGVASLAVLHALCLAQFYRASGYGTALQITVNDSFVSAPELDAFKPVTDFEKRRLALRASLPSHAADLWPALVSLEDSTRKQLFAHCVGASINAVREYPSHQRQEQIAHSHQLQEALGLHMVSTGWTPSVALYLGRVSKGQILAAVTEARGPEAASVIAPLKKVPMAEQAETLLQGTGWLPEPLRSHAPSMLVEETEVDVSTAVEDEVMAVA